MKMQGSALGKTSAWCGQVAKGRGGGGGATTTTNRHNHQPNHTTQPHHHTTYIEIIMFIKIKNTAIMYVPK